jgi:2',3'-cyclic-nucleotide 2'-phosphodiesterase (5'-nucleotidase family)
MNRWLRTVAIVGAPLAVLLVAGPGWSQALGTAAIPLDAREQTIRVEESTMGDLAADAVRVALKAEVGLVFAGEFRSRVIPPGDVTREALASVLLYPQEQVVVAAVRGDKLLAALEESLSNLPRPNAGFLQVSNLRVDYRSAAPAGQRIASVEVAGRPLEPAKNYRVAMPKSLAEGQMGYFRVFKGLKLEGTEPPTTLIGALVSYVTDVKTVDITPGQRIRDLTPPDAR